MLFSNLTTSLKNRRKNNKSGTVYWTRTNIVLVSGSLIVFPTCALIILSSLTSSLFASIQNSYYSTSIPWIDNASECEHTGRNWSDRKCWDNEHNPMF
jgi:hypothetical protein